MCLTVSTTKMLQPTDMRQQYKDGMQSWWTWQQVQQSASPKQIDPRDAAYQQTMTATSLGPDTICQARQLHKKMFEHDVTAQVHLRARHHSISASESKCRTVPHNANRSEVCRFEHDIIAQVYLRASTEGFLPMQTGPRQAGQHPAAAQVPCSRKSQPQSPSQYPPFGGCHQWDSVGHPQNLSDRSWLLACHLAE